MAEPSSRVMAEPSSRVSTPSTFVAPIAALRQ